MGEKKIRAAGWVLSGLFALFMAGASAFPKLAGIPVAQEIMAGLGWPDAPVLLIGWLELGCTVLYLVPQTSVLGATLMMAILGGAITTQLRAGSPLLSHTLFGVWLGIAMWGGLWLRDPAFRQMFPFRRK